MDEKRIKRKSAQSTPHFKKRRLQLKEERREGQKYYESMEGATYGVDPLVEPGPEALAVIPEPDLDPGPPSPGIGNNAMVVFDLETTGFDLNSDIIQIAAKEIRSGQTFSRYIYPSSGVIPSNIFRLTGISLHNGRLRHYGKLVSGCTAAMAEREFIQFLRSFSPAVLVAHNVLFDSKILLNSLQKNNINYRDAIQGFGDTLRLFKKENPQRKSKGLGYKQVDLVRDILDRDYTAHSADEDVHMLCDLINSVPNFTEKIPAYTTESTENRLMRIRNSRANLPSYDTVIRRGVLSSAKCKALASAGLSLLHIKTVLERSGDDGLLVILKRVLSSPRVAVSSLYSFLTG